MIISRGQSKVLGMVWAIIFTRLRNVAKDGMPEDVFDFANELHMICISKRTNWCCFFRVAKAIWCRKKLRSKTAVRWTIQSGLCCCGGSFFYIIGIDFEKYYTQLNIQWSERMLDMILKVSNIFIVFQIRWLKKSDIFRLIE